MLQFAFFILVKLTTMIYIYYAIIDKCFKTDPFDVKTT